MLSINFVMSVFFKLKQLSQLCFKLLLVSLHISAPGPIGKGKGLRSPLSSLLLSLLASVALIIVIIFTFYWLLVVFLG